MRDGGISRRHGRTSNIRTAHLRQWTEYEYESNWKLVHFLDLFSANLEASLVKLYKDNDIAEIEQQWDEGGRGGGSLPLRRDTIAIPGICPKTGGSSPGRICISHHPLCGGHCSRLRTKVAFEHTVCGHDAVRVMEDECLIRKSDRSVLKDSSVVVDDLHLACNPASNPAPCQHFAPFSRVIRPQALSCYTNHTRKCASSQ